jgi:cytoskeletal protein CcmA (bactofilin family)
MSQPVATQPSAARSADESLIAREDTFEGQLNTTRGVRIMGTVRGGIESQQYVHIEENARVEADITAEEVVIAGEYSGKLNCRQRVEIRATGRVSGQIETQKLQLHEGGYFDGELHMQKPTAAPAAAATPGGAGARSDSKDQPRRTRYVDLSSDSTREVGATDSPST